MGNCINQNVIQLMKKIIIVYFLILNISCNHKTISEKVDENHIVSDNEVYSFLNFILEKQSKTISKCRNENVIELITENSELKKIFTDKDLIFIKKQTENENKFEINSEYLNNVNLVSQKKIKTLFSKSRDINIFWKKFEKEFGTESFFSVSLPIFSLNKKIVIINTEFNSKGGFGYGASEVYIKVNGEWKIYKRFTGFIS